MIDLGLLVIVISFTCILASRPVKGSCDDVVFVTRSQWAARPPNRVIDIDVPVNMTFIHHTAGVPCADNVTCVAQVQGIQNLHMDVNGWDDIAYSFLIGEDGRVYEGRGWNVEQQGAFQSVYHSIALSFCVIGNYMETLPNEAAIKSTQNIISCGVEQGHLTTDYELFGHRDGSCTECPGTLLYADIQAWPHYSNRTIPILC